MYPDFPLSGAARSDNIMSLTEAQLQFNHCARVKLIMKEVYIKSVANEAIDTYFQKKKIVLIIHYCRATSIINTTKLVRYHDIKNWHSFARQ